MKMEQCPKFAKCSANICPLDPKMLKRVHLDGEPICVYLREYAKPGGNEVLQGVIAKEHIEAIHEVFPLVLASYAPIKKALKRVASGNTTQKSFSEGNL